MSYKRIRVDRETTKDEHRLIMESFMGRRLKRKEIVHHKNGNPLDNRLDNLEVMSLEEHGRLHRIGQKPYQITMEGRLRLSDCNRGQNNPQAKLTDKLVKYIKVGLGLGIRVSVLARELNIDDAYISQIKSGRRWRHIQTLFKPS